MKGRDAVLSGDRFSKILPVALSSLFAGQVPPADTPKELVMRLQKEFDLLSTPDLDQHRLPKLLTRAGIKILDGLPPNIERKRNGTIYRCHTLPPAPYLQHLQVPHVASSPLPSPPSGTVCEARQLGPMGRNAQFISLGRKAQYTPRSLHCCYAIVTRT